MSGPVTAASHGFAVVNVPKRSSGIALSHLELGTAGGNYFCFKGIGPERGERGSGFKLISIRSGGGKTAEVRRRLEVRGSLQQSERWTPPVPSTACVRVGGIFTLLLYRCVFPLGGGVGQGLRGAC